MICMYRFIELISKKKNGDIYVLENINPGKVGHSEWIIWDITRLDSNEFEYSGERGMVSKRRKDLNDVFEGYLKYRVNTDEPVLCLELPQEPLDKYGECKRKIENLFR